MSFPAQCKDTLVDELLEYDKLFQLLSYTPGLPSKFYILFFC